VQFVGERSSFRSPPHSRPIQSRLAQYWGFPTGWKVTTMGNPKVKCPTLSTFLVVIVVDMMVCADSPDVLVSKGGASALFPRRLSLSHSACPDNHNTTTITTVASIQCLSAVRLFRPLDPLDYTERPPNLRYSRDVSWRLAGLAASFFGHISPPATPPRSALEYSSRCS
jgi:hypothetical protein